MTNRLGANSLPLPTDPGGEAVVIRLNDRRRGPDDVGSVATINELKDTEDTINLVPEGDQDAGVDVRPAGEEQHAAPEDQPRLFVFGKGGSLVGAINPELAKQLSNAGEPYYSEKRKRLHRALAGVAGVLTLIVAIPLVDRVIAYQSVDMMELGAALPGAKVVVPQETFDAERAEILGLWTATSNPNNIIGWGSLTAIGVLATLRFSTLNYRKHPTPHLQTTLASIAPNNIH